MNTAPGKLYSVAFALRNAALLSSTWMVGALAARYPAGEVVAIESYVESGATVIMRWRRASEIIEGDVVRPTVEGLQVPGEALPTATVTAITELDLHTHPQDLIGQSIDSLPEEGSIAVKLGAAGALLLAVWYLSRRVGRDDDQSGTTQSRAA